MPAADEPGRQISGSPEPAGWRDVHDTESGETAQVPLYRRSELGAGDGLDGPALIVEEQTSTFVSRTFRAVLEPARKYRAGTTGLRGPNDGEAETDSMSLPGR